jgi:hypothetical protein
MPEPRRRATAVCEVLGRFAKSSKGELAERSADRRPVPARGVTPHRTKTGKGNTIDQRQ